MENRQIEVAFKTENLKLYSLSGFQGKDFIERSVYCKSKNLTRKSIPKWNHSLCIFGLGKNIKSLESFQFCKKLRIMGVIASSCQFLVSWKSFIVPVDCLLAEKTLVLLSFGVCCKREKNYRLVSQHFFVLLAKHCCAGKEKAKGKKRSKRGRTILHKGENDGRNWWR